MYGAFSGMSFGLVAGAALIVIALAFFASPLIAVIIAAVIAVGLLIGMAALRQLSAKGSPTGGDTSRRPRSDGEPASGEG